MNTISHASQNVSCCIATRKKQLLCIVPSSPNQMTSQDQGHFRKLYSGLLSNSYQALDSSSFKQTLLVCEIKNLWSTGTKNKLSIKSLHDVEMDFFHLKCILGINIGLF